MGRVMMEIVGLKKCFYNGEITECLYVQGNDQVERKK